MSVSKRIRLAKGVATRPTTNSTALYHRTFRMRRTLSRARRSARWGDPYQPRARRGSGRHDPPHHWTPRHRARRPTERSELGCWPVGDGQHLLFPPTHAFLSFPAPHSQVFLSFSSWRSPRTGRLKPSGARETPSQAVSRPIWPRPRLLKQTTARSTSTESYTGALQTPVLGFRTQAKDLYPRSRSRRDPFVWPARRWLWSGQYLALANSRPAAHANDATRIRKRRCRVGALASLL